MAKASSAEIVKKGGIEWRVYEDARKTWHLYARVGGKQIQVNRKTKQAVLDAIPQKLMELGNTEQRLVLSISEARDFQEARKLLEPFKASLAEAARVYVASMRKVDRELTLKAAGDEFLAEKQAVGVSDDYDTTLGVYLRRWCNEFGHVNLTALKGAELAAWAMAQELGPHSKNNLRNTLITLLRWCQRKGLLPRDEPLPTDAIPRLKTRKERNPLLSPEQLDAILEAAKGHSQARLFCAFTCLTSIRSGELERLTWTNVHFESNVIEVGDADAKTGARRLTPMPARLKEVLQQERGEGKGPIFTLSHIQEPLTKIAKSMVWTDGPLTGRKVLPAGWGRNAGRHSWISYRVALTGDVPKTALEAGNSPAKIFSNYLSVRLPEPDGRVIVKELAEKWFGLH